MRIYLYEPFEHTHENQFFRELARMLETAFRDDPLAVLIGNPVVDGCKPDALFIRNGQISILEFKNYGGGSLDYSEEDVWIIDYDDETYTEIDYSGRDINLQNPLQQVRRYRYRIFKHLEDKLWDFPTAPDALHTTAIVLFHRPVTYDRSQISADVQKYFHICDPSTIVDSLKDIWSKKLDLKEVDITSILKLIGIREDHHYDLTHYEEPAVESTVVEVSAVNETLVVNPKEDDPPIIIKPIRNEKEHFDKLFALAKDLVGAQISADAADYSHDDVKSKKRKDGNNIHSDLVYDLKTLSEMDGTQGYGVLGHVWGSDSFSGLIHDEVDPNDVVAITPLNEKQRKAVAAGLSRRLTGITGPPGTGKTQVVLNLAVNALLRGENVVITSKNNRAIDVVRDRFESILGMPYGLRIGQLQDATEHQSKYLTRLVNRKMNQLDQDRTTDIEVLKQRWLDSSETDRQSVAIEWLLAVIEHDISKMDLELIELYMDRLSAGTMEVSWLFLEDETFRIPRDPDIVKEMFHKQHRLIFSTALTARLGLCPFPESVDLVIIDEASQCDLISMYPMLVRAKRAVVIGDPLQLKHVTKVTASTDAELAEKYAFPPLGYPKRSLYDAVYQRLKKLGDNSIIFLLDHFRCHRDMVDFVNANFYEPNFGVGLNPMPDHVPVDGGWFWHDVKGQLVVKSNGNPKEAEGVANVYRETRKKLGKDIHIGIIAPFKHQVALIEDQLSDVMNSDDHLTIDTVHRFQGDERDVIILSVTVAPGEKSDRLADVINNQSAYLLNVAVTRAKRELHVVGDREYLHSLGRNTTLGRLARWGD